jgi:hypothetical protein
MSDLVVNNPFGGCPRCGQVSGFVFTDRGKASCVCDEHRTKWEVPSNTFLGWRAEHLQQWKQNQNQIREYRPVEPLPWNTPRAPDAPPQFEGELELVTS